MVFVCQIWAACMTSSDNYVPFVISRWISGMFAAVPTVLTPSYIMDIFFLHQRGRAFASLEISLLTAVIISPTLGGFIVQSKPWPYTFWWTLGSTGAALALVFCFLEETSFSSDPSARSFPERPESFLKNRIGTLLPGNKVVPSTTVTRVVSSSESKIGHSG